LGAKGANASYPVSFQLEPCVRDCGPQSHELPVSVVRRQRKEGTGGRVSQSAQSASEAAAADHLGRCQAPHAAIVRQYLDSLEGHIQITFLPPYCPELNPVEYLWAWLKRHAIANFCPDNLDELHTVARNKLKSAQHRPSIIAACWIQASLW